MKRAPPDAVSGRPVVRVVHPAGALGVHRAAVEAGLAELERAGCRVRWDPARAGARWRGYLAGTDAERAGEVVAALEEPEVEIVWFARGGSGTARVAESVVTHAAGCRPRVVIGFSDATSLLNALATRLGWITFLGPVVASLTQAEPDTDLAALFELLRGRRTLRLAASPQPTVEGRLLGGNLSVLAATAGTPLWPTCADPALWVLEDTGEAPYRLDRLFTQVRGAGLLQGCAAVWLGDLGLDGAAEPRARAMFQIDAAPAPVLHGAPVGHRGPLGVLPLGARVRLTPEHGRLEALEPWVRSTAR